MEADKYSGIVTVIAVVLAVIYADGEYDIWDAALGVLVITLSLIYKRGINKDRITSVLSAFLFSLGFVVVLYTSLLPLKSNECISKILEWNHGILDMEFLLVSFLTLPLSFFWHLSSSDNKSSKKDSLLRASS